MDTDTSSPAAGGALHCRRGGNGEGPTLVLLHGLGAAGHVWDRSIAIAERDWPGPWIAPDLRGHGRSFHAAPYGIGQHGADVAALVEPGSEIVALGHSMGGVVALALASGWFGVTVRRAIGVGIKVRWTDAEAQAMAARAEAPVKWLPDRDAAVARYLKIAGLDGLIAPDDPALDDVVVHGAQGWRVAADPRIFAVGPPPMDELLAAARAPVRLACGERDHMVTIDDLAALTRDPVVLPGLGHNPHVEDPKAVWALIEAGDV